MRPKTTISEAGSHCKPVPLQVQRGIGGVRRVESKGVRPVRSKDRSTFGIVHKAEQLFLWQQVRWAGGLKEDYRILSWPRFPGAASIGGIEDDGLVCLRTHLVEAVATETHAVVEVV